MTCLAIMLAASLSAGNAEFDRVAAEGAAKIAMGRFADSLAKGAIDGSILKEAMLADPSAHKTPAESREKCRKLWMEEANKAWAAESEAVRKRLSLEDGFALDMTGGETDSIEARFAEEFAKERAEAVAVQAKSLVTELRPGEAEFELLPRDALRREMTSRIAAGQKTAVFEENLAAITAALVDPILKSGEAELKRQREYVKKVRSDAASPRALEADISSKLEANVAERRSSKPPSEAWGVFPSVKMNDVPLAAERRAEERFADEIEAVKLKVDPAGLKATMAADPAAHAKAKDSEKIFALKYSSMALEEALAKSVAAAPQSERGELEEWLKSRFGSERSRKAVERLVKREVMPQWRKVRASVADELASSVWPALMDGTWCPAAELADAVVARSDFGRAVREWRKLEGMEAFASAGGKRAVMEEAAAAADRKVEAAFSMARNAIAAQSALADEVHPAVLAEARSRKASFFRRTPDLAAITEILTEAVEEGWKKKRLETLWPDGGRPSNAEAQHKDLFPSVKRKIELLAREILEEMNSPEEPQPEEKVEQPQSEDGKEPDEGGLTLRVFKGGKKLAEEKAGDSAASFMEAAERLSRKIPFGEGL